MTVADWSITGGVFPGDLLREFIEQALRPVTVREAVAMTLEHLDAHGAAKRKAPALVIEMREAAGAFGRFAANDAGLITGGISAHVTGWGSAGVDVTGGGEVGPDRPR